MGGRGTVITVIEVIQVIDTIYQLRRTAPKTQGESSRAAYKIASYIVSSGFGSLGPVGDCTSLKIHRGGQLNSRQNQSQGEVAEP